MAKREVLHYTRGGRFIGRGRVMILGRNQAACGKAKTEGGALDPAKVNCKSCLRFLRLYVHDEGEP